MLFLMDKEQDDLRPEIADVCQKSWAISPSTGTESSAYRYCTQFVHRLDIMKNPRVDATAVLTPTLKRVPPGVRAANCSSANDMIVDRRTSGPINWAVSRSSIQTGIHTPTPSRTRSKYPPELKRPAEHIIGRPCDACLLPCPTLFQMCNNDLLRDLFN